MIKLINNELSEADQTIAIVPYYCDLFLDKEDYAKNFLFYMLKHETLISTIHDHNCSLIEVYYDCINPKILLSDKEIKSLIPTICKILNDFYFIFEDMEV